MEQARSIVRHDIGVPRNEESAGATAVETLARAGFGAEWGGRSRFGSSSFIVSGQRRCVVGPVIDGAAGEVVVQSHHTGLALAGGLFKVAISHGPRRVVGRDELVLDFNGERHPPHMRFSFSVAVDPTHASLGCISGSRAARVLGNDLSQVRRATPHISC